MDKKMDETPQPGFWEPILNAAREAFVAESESHANPPDVPERLLSHAVAAGVRKALAILVERGSQLPPDRMKDAFYEQAYPLAWESLSGASGKEPRIMLELQRARDSELALSAALAAALQERDALLGRPIRMDEREFAGDPAVAWRAYHKQRDAAETALAELAAIRERADAEIRGALAEIASMDWTEKRRVDLRQERINTLTRVLGPIYPGEYEAPRTHGRADGDGRQAATAEGGPSQAVEVKAQNVLEEEEALRSVAPLTLHPSKPTSASDTEAPPELLRRLSELVNTAWKLTQVATATATTPDGRWFANAAKGHLEVTLGALQHAEDAERTATRVEGASDSASDGRLRGSQS